MYKNNFAFINLQWWICLKKTNLKLYITHDLMKVLLATQLLIFLFLVFVCVCVGGVVNVTINLNYWPSG